MMLNIGCHLSSSKGYEAMGKTALSIDANTFQFFTRNPRGGKMKPINLGDIEALNKILADHFFAPVLAHAPYTLNPCALDEKLRDFARDVFKGDLELLENIPGAMYNFHPGSHVKQGSDVGIEKIADILNEILWPEQKTMVLLETMSGKGSEVGRTFEEIRAIIDKVELKDKLGVCLDTCHIWDAGYDIQNNLEEVISSFDKVIGIDRLKAIHINDSLNALGSHKDRHACIGKGNIGFDSFVRIINHPKFRCLPFYLETPNELPGYAMEIKLLRSSFIE